MPPKGYRHVSLREDVYKKLEELASKLGFTSLNDLLIYLLESYNVVLMMGSLDEKLSKILSILLETKKVGKAGEKG